LDVFSTDYRTVTESGLTSGNDFAKKESLKRAARTLLDENAFILHLGPVHKANIHLATMRMLRFLPPFLILALPIAGASQKLAVDPEASSVTFVGHATGHSFHGSVTHWTLDLTVPDGADIPDKAVFTAKVLDLTTDHKKRDEEMMHWIEPEKADNIMFELTEISATDEGQEAEGKLMLHGIELPITIPIQITRDGNTLTVSGEVVVDHQLWGLPKIRKFGLLTVAPEVDVAFNVSGTLE
jgi:polyisoprenoid-binding protein YceI